jgi:hypothetical protein
MMQALTRLLSPYSIIGLFLGLTVPALYSLDTVILTNGDRLTGELEKLEEGKLSFRTPYSGTISIDWQQVQELITENRAEIEVGTGRLYRGSFEKTDEGLKVATEEQEVLTADVPDIVRITSYEDGDPLGFFDILEGAVDIGFNFTRGNSRLNSSSVGLQGKYRRPTYELSAGATSLFSRQDGSEPTSRQTADARYDRFLSPKQFAFGLAGFERNDRQQLNLRSRLGGGYGYKVTNTKDTELSLLGGFTFINEQFREDPDAPPNGGTSSGEVVAGIDYRTVVLKGIGITTKLSFLPNLVQTGRYRIEYDSTARIPLMGGFTWSLSLFDRFDSKPPRTDVQRNDYGVVTAFGYAF